MLESSGTLVCGGDWSIQLQPKFDSTNLLKFMCLSMRKLLKESGMIDGWRNLHSTKKNNESIIPLATQHTPV